MLTALASWLQAKSQGGVWLVRIDDLDKPRCQPGAADQILRQLQEHGLTWDEPPRYQSRHQAEYEAAIQQLRAHGLLYTCTCTRALLAENSRGGPDGPVYAGSCRDAGHADAGGKALRLRTTREITAFEDGWLGQQQRHMDTEVGDFTIRRSDGIPAYQLACAVDEAAQRITEVVRGADLLGSTFRQLYLSHKLHLDIPGYRHLPVLVDLEHRKLSKQNHAKPVAAAKATDTLLRCLKYLGQPAPMEFHDAKPGEILDWALVHWQAQKVPRALEMTVVD